MADDADGKPRCGAKTRGPRAGRTCQNFPVDGSARCRMHGGKNQPGSDASPGAPPRTFRYSQVLRSDEDRELYESARTALGKLDEEIALARTNLARFQRSVEDASKGGIPTSVSDGGRSISIRSYADIVQEYLDLIGKLEERRARILQAGVGGDRDHGDVDRYLAALLADGSAPEPHDA